MTGLAEIARRESMLASAQDFLERFHAEVPSEEGWLTRRWLEVRSEIAATGAGSRRH